MTRKCLSVHESGRVCKRSEGHKGMHWDTSFRYQWTDSDDLRLMAVDPPEPEPDPHEGKTYIKDTWLTEREVQVLQTAADGMSTVRAAEVLGLRINTVKTHKARIAKKLGAENTAHAVAMAFRAGALQ
jgi:DNA-binding CsgD family transcriptional regulator